MTLRLRQLVLAGLLCSGAALANEPSQDASSADETAAPSDDVAIDVDAPAVDTEAEGEESGDRAGEISDEDTVWTWVARMEGEVPTQETVEAVKERREEQLAERSLIDELGGISVPEEFYSDPVEALTPDPLFLDLVDPSEFDIPIVVNDEVEKWVRYFTGNGRRYFARYLSRSTRYQPLMYEKLEEAGLPRDLVYLSMIESGYNAHAYSKAHAVGLWQFIPSTGRLYDLRVDWWVDERRDPEKSTDAALHFLSDLYEMFGDWPLAWASYNTGPGRVRRSIDRSGSRDFWVLARGTYLASETDNYVPKIMAAAIIGKHPERYGFTDIEYKSEFTFEETVVDGSTEVAVLARCAGLTEDEFRWYNPHIQRWATPNGKTVLRLPVETAESFTLALADVPASERLSYARHKVRRGETLSAIASRYGVTNSSLVRVNRLSNADRILVGMTLIIPIAGAETQVADSAATRATDASPRSSSRPDHHTVRRGDTLSAIATRYSVSVSNLQAWNGLAGSKILVGQKIALAGSGSGTASSSSGASTTTYTIKRGDNLSNIAARYGVTTNDLQTWNSISNPSRIFVGQVLTIHMSSSGWKNYTVKAGDSLGAIATREGCSVADLKSWNGISGSVIHPGQKLKIRR